MEVSSPKSRIIWEGEGNFPHDWIAPGEYRYCGCGYYLLPKGTLICAHCQCRPRLGDYVCFCGNQASMMSVHGFRCDEHKFQKEPSQAVINDKLTFTTGQLRKDFNIDREAIAKCDEIHQQLLAERNALAQQRHAEGVKRLFWMDEHK